MVNGPPIPGPVLDCRDVGVTLEVRRDHEAAVEIGPACRHGEFFVHLQYQVRRAERPVVGKARRCRRNGSVSLRSTSFGPRLEDLNVLPGQRRVVLELRPDSGHWLPRRHRPIARDRRNVVGPLPCLLIRLEREWTHLVTSVTVLTTPLKDWPDVFQVRRRRDVLRSRLLAPAMGTEER